MSDVGESGLMPSPHPASRVLTFRWLIGVAADAKSFRAPTNRRSVPASRLTYHEHPMLDPQLWHK